MPVVRDALPTDAPACAALYAPYVRRTAVSFETEAPDAAAFADRIADAQARHAWLVAEQDGDVLGYACAHRFSGRAAYGWSCETSVYLRQGLRRTGLGRALMGALLERLAVRGHRRAFAGVVLPNEASVGLHESLGFRPVARFERVGWKLGSWHDVAWFERDLLDDERDPPPPPA